MLNISFKDRKIVPMFSSGDSTTPDFKQWTKEKLDEMQNYFNYDISDFIIESIRYVLFGIIPSKKIIEKHIELFVENLNNVTSIREKYDNSSFRIISYLFEDKHINTENAKDLFIALSTIEDLKEIMMLNKHNISLNKRQRKILKEYYQSCFLRLDDITDTYSYSQYLLNEDNVKSINNEYFYKNSEMFNKYIASTDNILCATLFINYMLFLTRLNGNSNIDKEYVKYEMIRIQELWENQYFDICVSQLHSFSQKLEIKTEVIELFNKDVLDTYGINPLELDTWDKFVAALEKIRDESNGEVAPMFLAGSEVGITGFFTNSLCAVNVGGNEAAGANALLHGEEFDWKYVAQVMQAYKDLADNELFNDGYMTAQVPDMIEAIATGKCAFIFLGTQVMEGASAANPDLNWGFMPYPAMSDLGATEPAFVNGEQGTYGIWKDSPNLEVARKVLEYLAQPENIAYYCNNSGKPAGIDGVELELAEKNEYYGIFTDVKAVGQFDRTYLPNGLFDVMGDAQAKVLMGSIDAEEGAKMMQEEYDRLFGKAE